MHSVPSYEREKERLVSSYEAKIEQLEKKIKCDVDLVKEEKEKALDKVGFSRSLILRNHLTQTHDAVTVTSFQYVKSIPV